MLRSKVLDKHDVAYLSNRVAHQLEYDGREMSAHSQGHSKRRASDEFEPIDQDQDQGP